MHFKTKAGLLYSICVFVFWRRVRCCCYVSFIDLSKKCNSDASSKLQLTWIKISILTPRFGVHVGYYLKCTANDLKTKSFTEFSFHIYLAKRVLLFFSSPFFICTYWLLLESFDLLIDLLINILILISGKLFVRDPFWLLLVQQWIYPSKTLYFSGSDHKGLLFISVYFLI